MSQAVVRKIHLTDPREWVQLCGEREGTLRSLKDAFEVQLVARGNEILLSGEPEEVARATQVLERLRGELQKGHEGYISPFQVEQAIAHEKNPGSDKPEPPENSGDTLLLSSRKKPIDRKSVV